MANRVGRDGGIDDPNIREGGASNPGNAADELMIHHVDNRPVDEGGADRPPTPGSDSGIVINWKPFAVGAIVVGVVVVSAFTFLKPGAAPGSSVAPGSSPAAGATSGVVVPGASGFNGPARAYVTVNGTLHYLTGGFCTRQATDFGPDSAGPHDLFNAVIAEPNLDSFIMQLAWSGAVDDENFTELRTAEWLVTFQFGDLRKNVRLSEFGLADSQIVTAGLYHGPQRVTFTGTYHDNEQDLPVNGVVACEGDLRQQTQSQPPSS
jgi:hypothetical protein